jgi:hypothetical protein
MIRLVGTKEDLAAEMRRQAAAKGKDAPGLLLAAAMLENWTPENGSAPAPSGEARAIRPWQPASGVTSGG